MIAHKLHLFLVHSSSFILVSPKVQALFVPWKNKPEVTTPPPTSCFTVELIIVLGSRNVGSDKSHSGAALTRTRGNPPSRPGS